MTIHRFFLAGPVSSSRIETLVEVVVSNGRLVGFSLVQCIVPRAAFCLESGRINWIGFQRLHGPEDLTFHLTFHVESKENNKRAGGTICIGLVLENSLFWGKVGPGSIPPRVYQLQGTALVGNQHFSGIPIYSDINEMNQLLRLLRYSKLR